uniref:Transcriptional regulator n=1 Tax=Ascaris lumbricoides TaxID=6252 RepID=A0A0M3HYK5_ASCLU
MMRLNKNENVKKHLARMFSDKYSMHLGDLCGKTLRDIQLHHTYHHFRLI